MKKLMFCLSAAALAAGAASAQTKWDLPTGYSRQQLPDPERAAVRQRGRPGSRAASSRSRCTPGGSLYKANEIKRAVQTGQVQIGRVHPLGRGQREPAVWRRLHSVPGHQLRQTRSALYQAAKPAQDKLLASQGIKVLFTVPWPGQSLYSLKPINTPADFAGTKMRAYNPATTRIAQLLKAQPVTIQLAELGQALATGGGAELPDIQCQRRREQAA
jgi:TRAP-type C4-dicarboxylate transport system substrate-binding protein